MQFKEASKEDLFALNDFVKNIHSTLSYVQVIKKSLSGLYSILDLDAVFYFKKQDGALVLEHFFPDDYYFSEEEFDNHREDECLCGLAASCLEAVFASNIHKDPRCSREECKRAGFTSFAAIPLQIDGKLAAIIGLASKKERVFDLQKVFIENLASFISLALNNALNYKTACSQSLKRAAVEEKLDKSLINYKILIQNQFGFLLKINTKGMILYASPNFCSLLNISEKQLTGASFLQFLQEKDKQEFQNSLDKLLEGQKEVHLELEMQNSKTNIWTFWHLKRLYDNQEKEQAFILSGENIDRLKKLQLALSNSESSLRSIISALPLGLLLFKQEPPDSLVFLEANSSALAIWGKTSILRGLEIEKAFPLFKNKELLASLKKKIKQGYNWTREITEYSGTKLERAFQLCAFPISEKRFVLLTEDISAKKSAELQLVFFKEAVESSTDAIGISDPSGRHFYQNEAFNRTFGNIGEDPPASLYADEKMGREVFDTIKRGGQWTGEVEMLDKEGAIRHIHLRAYASKDKEGRILVLVGIHTDMTEQKRLLALSEKNQKLESLAVLAGGVAHDFNNLLAGIYGNIDLALSEDSCSVKVRGFLEKALDSMERSRALTHQLLTFSKGGAPSLRLKSLLPFLEQAVSFALSGSVIASCFKIDKELWPCAYDQSQLGQVIDNLVINAVQAMPQGGELIITAKNVNLKKNDYHLLSSRPYVKISIQDTGDGIPERILDKIFDPFFTTKSQGHGLGLASSYSILRKHKGLIIAESEVGQGSVFSFFIPAYPEAKVKVSQNKEDIVHQGNGRFLVLDDEKVIRMVLKEMLAKLGYEVVLAAKGEQALDIFTNQGPFAAVILDLTIPGSMGGLAVLREMRKIDKTTAVFSISGYADNQDFDDKLFTAAIKKPFNFRDLREILKKYLE